MFGNAYYSMANRRFSGWLPRWESHQGNLRYAPGSSWNPNGIQPSSPGLSRACGKLPWVGRRKDHLPQRGSARRTREWPLGQSHRTPPQKRSQSLWDWIPKGALTQGGSFLATLGFGSKSPWDLNESPRFCTHAKRFANCLTENELPLFTLFRSLAVSNSIPRGLHSDSSLLFGQRLLTSSPTLV